MPGSATRSRPWPRARREGIAAGDPVAIVLHNGAEFLVAFLAATWARAVAAPLNPAYKLDEFKFYMEDIGVRAAIVPPGAHPRRRGRANEHPGVGGPARYRRPDCAGAACARRRRRRGRAPTADDVAMFLHTSGTTSRPKGVPLRHGNLMASLANIAATYDLGPDDTSFIVMPLSTCTACSAAPSRRSTRAAR